MCVLLLVCMFYSHLFRRYLKLAVFFGVLKNIGLLFSTCFFGVNQFRRLKNSSITEIRKELTLWKK